MNFFKLALYFFLISVVSGFKILDYEYSYAKQGVEYFKKSDYLKSREFFENAFFTNPENPKNSFNLAIVQSKLGADSDAISSLKNSISFNDNDTVLLSKTYYNLGNIMMKTYNFKDAIKYFKNALKINPGFFNAKYNLKSAIIANIQNDNHLKNQSAKNSDAKKNSSQSGNSSGDSNKKNKNKNDFGDNSGFSKKNSISKEPSVSKEIADNLFQSAVNMNNHEHSKLGNKKANNSNAGIKW
ncbi:MAG TPA: tetratricopeptide repeat protein [bacterium]|nr:tetratricopeptide repeat protein [bacterium]HPN30524.1 tetratricopeptide repeat protein [bacterium]